MHPINRAKSTPFTRVVRASGLAAALVLIGAALVLVGDWLKTVGPPRLLPQPLVEVFLSVMLVGYPAIMAAAIFAGTILGWAVWRSRQRGQPRPDPRHQLRRARWLLLCGSSLLALVVAEAASLACLTWIHRLPALPCRLVEPKHPGDPILIVVIGESSALGVPYEGWLSVGAIIGRELQKAIPSRQFKVEVLAETGATLETMHLKLAGWGKRPDALIVYSGHNEFLARFSLANRVAFYFDEQSVQHRWVWLEHAKRLSPFYTLVLENLEKRRVSVIPARALGAQQTIVGRPVCTPEAAKAVVVDFHRRLEAIIADCERIGCMPIVIIPPGNDASDPNQSFATPWTGAEKRNALFHRLAAIRRVEAEDPAHAIVAYQQVVAEQPTHAQAHHRLARLLESAGSFAEAGRHYILARDHDGLPIRCITPLEEACRAVGWRHGQSTLLVDGPAVLRSKSRHGILDTDLFHDNVHPNLVGHVALAEAVLDGLKTRGAFGWPGSTPAPLLNPQECAAQFGLDAAAWAEVCDRSAVLYDRLAFLTIDSGERITWRDRYLTAARKIRAGTYSVDDAGIPGVIIHGERIEVSR